MSLPLDLIVQVLKHSDPVTIARGTATCKAVRRRVASPDFRAHMLRSDDRFLLGVLSNQRGNHQEEDEVRVYPLINPARAPSERPPIPVASFMSRTTDLFASASSYRVVASSGGLLALTRRGREQRKEVCVCDLATGRHVAFPPPPTVSGHLYVLLPPLEGDNNAADPPPSFRLLVADKVLRTQTFSSTEGGDWGPVTTTPWLPVWHHHIALMQRFPVVVGGVAHWLYRKAGTQRGPFHVVTLDVRTGQGRSFEVPQDCLRRLYGRCAYKNLVLAADGGGKLIVVVAETNAFSAWTVPEDAGGRWVRSVLIERDVIFRSVTAPLCPPLGCQRVVFEWFGEGTSSIVFQMHGLGLIVLNLRTKQIYQLESFMRPERDFELICPYELGLESLFSS